MRTFDADDTFVAMTDASVDATIKWVPAGEGQRACDEHLLTWWLLAWAKARNGATAVQELIDAGFNVRSTVLTDDALVKLLNACTARWAASRRRPLQGASDIMDCILDPSVPEDADHFLVDTSSFRTTSLMGFARAGLAAGADGGEQEPAATTPRDAPAASARPSRVTRSNTNSGSPPAPVARRVAPRCVGRSSQY